MSQRLQRLDWRGASLQLLLLAVAFLPLDALLGRRTCGPSGYVGFGSVSTALTLFRLPREKEGMAPKRQTRWTTVVMLLAGEALVPLASLVLGLLWLSRDLLYGVALLVNVVIATALFIHLLAATTRRRREGAFAHRSAGG